MGYDEADTRWSSAWLLLWVACCAVLAALVPFVRPAPWCAAFAVLFLLPEMVGLRRHRDALPPLTYVVRRYVPRWVPTAATFGCAAWLLAAWLPSAEHPAVVAVAVATFVGWLSNHWDVTYDA